MAKVHSNVDLSGVLQESCGHPKAGHQMPVNSETQCVSGSMGAVPGGPPFILAFYINRYMY